MPPLTLTCACVSDRDMAEAQHQIVGVCRFSYPSLGGFAGPQLDPAELEARLFSPKRLERRFELFETLTLPSLAAQTDRDFRLVVLIGRGLQMRYKNRLRDLAETYPFLMISQQDPSGPLVSTRKAFRRALEPGTDYVTGFRIDDDDAVAVDYIARTRNTAETLLREGWVGPADPAVIAFHRGIYWDLNASEQPFFDFKEKMPLGLASAMVAAADAQVNIFRWNHRHLPAHVRCWTDPKHVMFIRTLHQTNNSDRSMPPGALPIETADGMGLLRDRFGIDPDAAMALMA